MPACNAVAFSGTLFCWFCPRSVSLLAQKNVPLSTLLNARRCEHFWCDVASLLFARKRSDELPEDSSSSVRVSTLLGMIGSFPLLRGGRVLCLAAIYHIFFTKIMHVFYLGP